jgi:hypothetical protein
MHVQASRAAEVDRFTITANNTLNVANTQSLS